MPSLKFTRREFLKLGAASAALAGAGCAPPAERIVPYANQPENALPGVPRFYASAASFVGGAEGMLIEANTGRPTKVEGNPAHPGSLGATSVQGQAAVLQLWDPERSKAPRRGGQPATRDALARELNDALGSLRAGEGVRVLIDGSTSPTLARQLELLGKRFPAARVHRWDPLEPVARREGGRLAFGRPLEPLVRLEEAGAILDLDSRFLEDHPFRLNYARQYARGREVRGGRMSRLYVFESAPSLAGAVADHRYAMPAHDIESWLVEGDRRQKAILEDLKKNRGVILAGESLSPQAHARVHRLNGELGASVSYVPPAQIDALPLPPLVEDMRAGRVKLLLILEGNPAYDAPADLAFAEALAAVPLSVHLSLYFDETSARSTWHVPATHFMEHWSDARAFDGTAAIVQPVIAPLYDGVSPHEMVSLVLQESRRGYDIVRETWRDIDWPAALRSGVVPESASRTVKVAPRSVDMPRAAPREGWSVRFVPDQSVLDGRFANNAWLQELPRSESKITWDNAALLSPASAKTLGVAVDDMLEISLGERRLLAPVWLVPGHADGTVTLALGYGRTHAGSVGNGVGFNAFLLRTSTSLWKAHGVSLRKAPGHHGFATTQNHARMEGRDLARHVRLEELVKKGKAWDEETPRHSLYKEWPYEGYRWAMVVSLNNCVGCNACTIACQAENNIPVVGREEVIAGREMHWIRVDRYYQQHDYGEVTLFQPVPCMHCENAPCEYVCPVEAAVHDSEGLNLQVYNRCVGTRFCSQNCPYKVRRFNFLQYSSHDENLKAQKNPEVTVRRRGVMEKCTYCVQRIQRARIEAEKANRRIADGEVITACQAACPTGAIVFGDLNDPGSAVNRAKRSPLEYDLLAELNTRPRTSYEGRVLNRNPDLHE
ncbi:MAG TPA: 4Fe-4S dicluster domain-containing protein [Burkholderiales bacterium]|nr:4Fe-4S dicluster domain-containing protein [Burkholderiales bacterium]